MKAYLKGLLAVLLSCSAAANAGTFNAAGTITTFRNYPILQANTSARGASMFQLSAGSGLGNGCSWVYIDASDSNALALALSAKTLGAYVTIVYDNGATSPWGDTTICALVTITES